MGIGELAKNEAQGLVGNIAKAILVFPDSVGEVSLEDTAAAAEFGMSTGMNRVSAVSNAMNMKRVGLTKISAASANASQLTKKLDDVGSGMQNLKDAVDSDVIQGKRFTVQFNPASIQIVGRGGGRAPISNYGSIGKDQAGKIEYRALDPYITVSFSVLFDALNNADAFMEERFTLGATTLVKNVATAIVGHEYTVRPQVEGFLAALRDEDHRTMIFQWGSLRYTGVLNSVSARYTMFNTAGNPIRAEVNLGMLMGGFARDSMDGRSYLDYWKQRYSDIMNEHAKKDAAGNLTSMTTGNLKNQFTNIINL